MPPLYTKEQLLHLDLPEAFRDNSTDPMPSAPPALSWDLALLGITLFWLLDHDKE